MPLQRPAAYREFYACMMASLAHCRAIMTGLTQGSRQAGSTCHRAVSEAKRYSQPRNGAPARGESRSDAAASCSGMPAAGTRCAGLKDNSATPVPHCTLQLNRSTSAPQRHAWPWCNHHVGYAGPSNRLAEEFLSCLQLNEAAQQHV